MANIRLSITGLAELRQKLGRVPKKVEDAALAAMQETSIVGKEFAQGSAPTFTGAVRANILNFQQNKESWVVISKTPQSDFDFPVNVLFDTGDYPTVTGNEPRDPNTLFFMQKTANFMEEEFGKRLNLKIRRAIQ